MISINMIHNNITNMIFIIGNPAWCTRTNVRYIIKMICNTRPEKVSRKSSTVAGRNSRDLRYIFETHLCAMCTFLFLTEHS